MFSPGRDAEYRGEIANERPVPGRFREGITRYRPEDRDELTAFRRRMFGEGSRQVDPDRHRWLFEDNPYNDDAGPGIWLCRRDGEIVGQQAEIPFELRVGRDERRAAWAVDLMVDRVWRLRGVGPGLIATQLEGKSIVAGLNLSEQGFAAYQKAGWTDLGVVPVYLRPLDLRRALRLVPEPWGPRILRLLAPVAAPVWRFVEGLMAGLSRLRGMRLVEVERFDGRVDGVWSAAANHYPVLARRDRDALDWRLDQRPDRDQLRRYYLVRRRRTIGYVVLRTASRGGEPVVVVVDYLAEPRWVAPLLVAAGRAARKEGAVAMTVKTRNEPAGRSLRTAGFVQRGSPADEAPIRLMVHCTDEAGICALAEAPECWFVTSADSDLEPATVGPESTGTDETTASADATATDSGDTATTDTTSTGDAG